MIGLFNQFMLPLLFVFPIIPINYVIACAMQWIQSSLRCSPKYKVLCFLVLSKTRSLCFLVLSKTRSLCFLVLSKTRSFMFSGVIKNTKFMFSGVIKNTKFYVFWCYQKHEVYVLPSTKTFSCINVFGKRLVLF